MAKIQVLFNKQPLHAGPKMLRFEDEDAISDRSIKKRKPKAVKKTKTTEELVPRSTDENDQPRVSTKIWIALRDRDNPNRQQIQ